MKPGELVSYRSGADSEEYTGVITWVHEDEIGVGIISPDYVRGAAEVLNIAKDVPKVVEQQATHYIERDLSQFSVEELRAEIEELRSSRVRRATSPKTLVSDADKKILDKLSSLSSEELDRLLEE